MLKQLVPILILATIVSLAAMACGGGEVSTPTPTQRPSPPPPPRAPASAVASDTPTAAGQSGVAGDGTQVTVINHDLAGSGVYAFEPSEYSFKVGETVTFTLIGETELHSFTVDELEIDIDIDATVGPGATGTLTHTFDKAGTFRLVCIYHEGNGMVGTITVQ